MSSRINEKSQLRREELERGNIYPAAQFLTVRKAPTSINCLHYTQGAECARTPRGPRPEASGKWPKAETKRGALPDHVSGKLSAWVASWAEEEEVCAQEQSGAIHDPAVLTKCVTATWVHGLSGTPKELPMKH